MKEYKHVSATLKNWHAREEYRRTHPGFDERERKRELKRERLRKRRMNALKRAGEME